MRFMRLEKMKIAPLNKCDLQRAALQRLCGIQTAESTANNHHPMWTLRENAIS